MSWLDRAAAPGRPGIVIGLVAAVVSGLAWTLAAQPHQLWWLGWLAPLPVAWVIDRAPTRRRAGLYAGLAALVFTVGGFHWMTYLLRVNAHLPTPLAWLGLVLLGAYHGLVFLVGARLTRALRDRRREHPRGPWPMALCLPLGFVVVEVVLPTPFPFSLSLGQIDLAPLRHLAAFASTVGIVAIMTAVAGAAYDALTRPTRRWRPAAGVAAFIAVAAIGSVRLDDDRPRRTITIGIVQPNAPVDVPDRHARARRAARAPPPGQPQPRGRRRRSRGVERDRVPVRRAAHAHSVTSRAIIRCRSAAPPAARCSSARSPPTIAITGTARSWSPPTVASSRAPTRSTA
jgi:apolipoprotein N-acyltransferase